MDLAHLPTLDELCSMSLLNTSHEVIYFKDLESRFVRVSMGCAALHRRSQEALYGLTDFDLFDVSHAQEAFDDEQSIIATGVPILNKEECERWVDRPDTWVASSKFPLRLPDGTLVGTFGISRDITRRVVAERAAEAAVRAAERTNGELRRVESQLRAVLDGSTDAIARYDAELRYRYVNPAGQAMRRAGLDRLLGRRDRDLDGEPDSLAMWEGALRRVLETGEPDEVDVEVESDPPGDPAWFHTRVAPDRAADGTVVGVLTSTRDITELKRAERALAKQALHDSVTGLANRYLLSDRITQALARMERYPTRIALFFIDLDHFKAVNDSYGHEVGDRVLAEVARRLETLARKEDTVARLGGDEFVVLCDRLASDQDGHDIAGRIVRSLAAPIEAGPVTHRLSASVGCLVTDDPTVASGDLLRWADAAMYRAKQAGRDRFEVYDPHDAPTEPAGGPSLEPALRGALENDELRLVYQPLLSLADQRLLGFEALLRWEHPERGLLAPGEFLPVAEAHGLIGPIGAWVLDAACEQLAQWDRRRPADQPRLTMAVNLAGRQLRDPHLVDLVRAALERHGLAPAQLSLEITERTLVQEGDAARDILAALSALGVRLAVDDFGTTYTSLARLPHFPVSVVKLEQLADTPWRHGLAAAVIAMAHGLGMSVVGEGIETADQLTELVGLACDDGQGYLLGRPLSRQDVDTLLEQDEG